MPAIPAENRSADARACDIRVRRHAAALAAGGLGVIAAAAAIPRSWAEGGPVLCPFRLVTGLPCPACGLTRSAVAMMHGDLSAALADIAGSVTAALMVLGGIAVALVTLVSPRGGLKTRAAVPRWAWRGIAIAWLVYGLARILDVFAGTGLLPAVV